MPLTKDALIFGFEIGAGGEATSLAPPEIATPPAPGAWRWLHCDRLAPATRQWIAEEQDLPEPICEALLDEETRPRCEAFDDGTVIILRGVNLNPGAEPEDMVAIRLWVRPDRVISLRRYTVFAAEAIRDRIEAGAPPPSPAAFVAELIEGLTDRLSDAVEKLEDDIDHLEEESLEREVKPVRKKLTELRRDTIGFRRFLAPQREAVARLLALRPDWLDDQARAEIGESLDDLTRVVEMLDAVRDRAALLQESLANMAAEDMNRTMYVLSLVAAIFLPLSFVTGLLGINVGGIPGMDSPFGFAVVCAIMVVLFVLQLVLFRRMGWF